MMNQWTGIFPALTTKFHPNFTVDHAAIARHIEFQLAAGVHGVVMLGSLGENGTLTREEKLDILKTTLSTVRNRVPVLACIAECTTDDACRLAKDAAGLGVSGFMLLPPMRYTSDRRETMTYLREVAKSTNLPIMLYNNPVAYRVDITPEMFAELADEPRFVAIKESSDDVRRITDLRNLVGNRYQIFIGVDDLAMEALTLGADGWLAGLVCAFPKETVALYNYIRTGRMSEALALYRWFTPLLHLDVSVKFVQNIKLVEQLTGVGSETVRPPRLTLIGDERARVEEIVRTALAHRPKL